MVVVTLMAVIISFAVPRFQRTLENSRAQLAASTLKTIWTAQRLYYTQNHSFAPDLPTLSGAGLLDPYFITQNNDPQSAYVISIQLTESPALGFEATAQRQNTGAWTGSFSIDEQGTFSGSIVSSQDGYTILPSNN
jgi:type II secretory pathway pseudopilin PulG